MRAFGSEAIGLGASIANRPEVSVKVIKKWTDADKLDRSGVKLNLYRREQGESGYQKVAGTDEFIPSTVKPTNNETHTWSKLPLFSENQKQYEYFVREEFIDSANINNQNWTITEYTPVNFSSTMGGSTGTATVNNVPVTGDENLGKLTVTKKLLEAGNGVRSVRGPVGQRGTPIKFTFKVTGPAGYEKTFELAPGESKTLTGLYFGEYKVEETDSKNYTASYSVANGKVTLKANDKDKTVEVTNTSGGDGTVVEKTIEKVWVNGPKPTVTIELWRKNNVEGADKIDQKVDEFVVPANASGDALKKTFTKLAKHDSKGNEFEYYVKEENVPANYTKKIEGLKVTNSYTQPTDGEVEVTKAWQGPQGLAKPDINLTLYRKVQGGAEEKVPGADIKVVNGNVTTAKWTKLETTDKDGKPYSFIVKESFKNPGDINNGNWTLVESTNVEQGKATITNKAVTGDENLGKLTVTKKLLEAGNGVRRDRKAHV